MWSTPGRKTRRRPGSASCVVIRTPFCHRLLGDLDDDILPFLDAALDSPLRKASFRRAGGAPWGCQVSAVQAGRLDRPSPGERFHSGGARRPRGVLDIQKAVALETEIDEGRLQSGEYRAHASEINVAGHPAGAGSLDQHLHQQAILDQGDAHLTRDAVDVDRALH